MGNRFLANTFRREFVKGQAIIRMNLHVYLKALWAARWG